MSINNNNLDKVIRDFLTLKKIRRTGWQLRGIKEGESIADHCFGVVFLTYFLAPLVKTKIDRNKAVSIAIIHEIGETRVGDIPFVALKYFQNKSSIFKTNHNSRQLVWDQGVEGSNPFAPTRLNKNTTIIGGIFI